MSEFAVASLVSSGNLPVSCGGLVRSLCASEPACRCDLSRFFRLWKTVSPPNVAVARRESFAVVLMCQRCRGMLFILGY